MPAYCINAIIASSAVLLASSCVAQVVDLDDDGLDDALEQELINAHLPVLLYDSRERWWPMSCWEYVRNCRLALPSVSQSELAADPLLIIRQSAGPGPDHSTNALDHPESTRAVLASDAAISHGVGPTAVGMYGHVIRIPASIRYLQREPWPQGDPGDIVIQYWQFFPFNDSQSPDCCDCFPVSWCFDHEGDWVWLDVFVDGVTYQLKRIVYHHHGDANCAVSILPDEGPLPTNGRPRCYLEEGSHEWWHGANVSDCTGFGLYGDPHDGMYDPPINAANVINLGERFSPMPFDEAQLILGFNGSWGPRDGAAPPMLQTGLSPPSPYFDFLWIAFADLAAPAWASDRPGFATRRHPSVTVSGAAGAVAGISMQPGVLKVATGNYPEQLTIAKPITIKAVGGPVTIGR